MFTQCLPVRRLARFVSVTAALCALSCSPGARAQGKAALPDINPTITFHFNNVPPAEVLRLIFETSEQRYKVVPITLTYKLNAPPRLRLDVVAQTLQDSLRELFSQLETPLTFRVKNGIYIIEEDPHPNPNRRIKKPSVESKTSGPPAITYHASDVPFDEAVRAFFRSVNKPYRIDPSVPVFLETVTCDLEERTLPGALEKLLASVSHTTAFLTHRVENGVYVIAPRRPLTAYAGRADSGDSIDAPLKDVKIVNVSLGEALKTLFAQAKANGIFYTPSEEKEHLMLSLHNVSLGQAVARVARSLPPDWNLGSARNGSIYSIGDGFPPASRPADRPQTITLCLQTANLYDAIKALLYPARVNYTLDPILRQQKVTVTGTASSLEEALHLLLDAAPTPQTFKVENDIYSIVPK